MESWQNNIFTNKIIRREAVSNTINDFITEKEISALKQKRLSARRLPISKCSIGLSPKLKTKWRSYLDRVLILNENFANFYSKAKYDEQELQHRCRDLYDYGTNSQFTLSTNALDLRWHNIQKELQNFEIRIGQNFWHLWSEKI